MSKWIYDGYTKVKKGTGKKQRYIETYIYRCPDCGWTIRAERTALHPPRYCPNCKADMKEGEG